MKRLHKIMVVLLVLAYTGQALASAAVPCASMAPPAARDVHMEHAMGAGDKAAHAGHHMPAGELDGAAACCDGGLCSMSQCQAVPALLTAAAAGTPASVETYFQRAVYSSPIRPSYSLFKPPISL
jgi:hypothetical protein